MTGSARPAASVKQDPGVDGLDEASVQYSQVVTLQVLGHPELSTPPGGVRVDARGVASLPLLGDFAVVARPLADVHAEVGAALARYLRFPVFSIRVERAAVVDVAEVGR